MHQAGHVLILVLFDFTKKYYIIQDKYSNRIDSSPVNERVKWLPLVDKEWYIMNEIKNQIR